jgi:O-antigen ligase
MFALLTQPKLALGVVAAVIAAALARRSIAFPIAFAGLPAVVIGLTGTNPFPPGSVTQVLFAWTLLAIVFAVVREDDAFPLALFFSPPVVLSVLLAFLMLVRLSGSEAPSYGSTKLQLFLTGNLVLLVGGILIGRRRRELDFLVVLLLLVAGVSAIVLVRGLVGGYLQPVEGAGRFALSAQENPIELGRQAATGILLAIWVMLTARAGWMRMLALTLLPLIAVALVAAGSRGPVLGLLAGVIALLVLVAGDRESRRRILLVAGGTVAAVLLVPQLVAGEGTGRAFSFLSSGGSGLSSNGRVELWSTAWDLFGAHPLFGIGTGGFAAHDVVELYPHNLLLELGVETGILGLVLVGAIVGIAAVRLLRTWARARGDERAADAFVLALGTSAFVNASFSGDITTNSQLWLAIGLGVGLSLRTQAAPAALVEPIVRMRARRRDRVAAGRGLPALGRPRGRPVPPGASLPPGTIRNPGEIVAPGPGAAVRGAVQITAVAGSTGWGVASVEVQFAAAGGDWQPIGTLRDETFDVFAADEGARLHVAVVRSRRLAELIKSALEARDDAGVENVEIAPSRQRPWRTSGAQTALWDTDELEDGSYRLRVVSVDVAGTRTVSPETAVVVDNTAPVASLLGPGEGAVVAGPVWLSADAADDGSGIARVIFQTSGDGETWTEVARVDEAPYETEWDAAALRVGDAEIRAVAVDRAGNTAASPPVVIVVERPLDVLELILEDPGPIWNGRVELVADVRAGAAERVEFQLAAAGSEKWTSLGRTAQPFRLPLDTTELPDGTYEVRVLGVTASGSRAQSPSIERRIDNVPPTVAIASPADGAVLAGSVPVRVSAADQGSGVVSVLVQFNDGTRWRPIVVADLGASEVPWQTTQVRDGEYLLRAVAVDAAGNSATSDEVEVTVENLVAAELRDPGPVLAGQIELAAEPRGRRVPEAVEFQIAREESDEWISLGRARAPFALRVDTRRLEDGLYRLRGRVLVRGQEAGLTPELEPRAVDNSAPVVQLVAPPEGTRLFGVVAVRAEAFDVGSGVSAVRFEVALQGGDEWRELGRATGEPFELRWETSLVADGAYLVRAVAVDGAGNGAATRPRQVAVENALALQVVQPEGALRGETLLEAAVRSARQPDEVEFEVAPARTDDWRSVGRARAPFTLSLDTKDLDDGAYDVRVRALGGEGVDPSPSAKLVVDNTPPLVRLVAPEDGSVVHGVVQVRGEASDDVSGVAAARVELSDGDTWTSLGGPEAALDTSALADGDYVLRVVAADAAGNSAASDPVRIAVENAVKASLRALGPVLAGEVEVAAEIGSPRVPDEVEIQAAREPDGDWLSVARLAAPFAGTIDTRRLDDGPYRLRVRAVVAGEEVGVGEASEPRQVDNTAPVVALIAPEAGARVFAAVALEADAADAVTGVAEVRFQLAAPGGEWTDIATATRAPYEDRWSSTGVPDGPYLLRAIAVDVAGNVAATEPAAVTVENVVPARELRFEDPGDVLAGVVPIGVAVESGRPPDRVELEVARAGSRRWRTLATLTAAPFVHALDTHELGDGEYDLRATAFERDETVGEAALSGRTVDNTAPAVRLLRPAAGTLWGVVRVAADAEDDGSGVASVRIELSDESGEWRALLAAAEGEWDTSALADGPYRLRAVAEDRAGNAATSEPVAVALENVVPSRDIRLADPGRYARATVQLEAELESGRPPERIELEVARSESDHWRTVATLATAPYDAALDTVELEDGVYDLRVRAFERGQVVGEDVVREWRVDNTPPAVRLSEPATAARIWGSVHLAADAADEVSGLARVTFELSRDGNDWRELGAVGEPPFAIDWDTTEADDGPCLLRAVAVDRAGNSAPSVPVAIDVENVLPGVELRLADPGRVLHGTVDLPVDVDAERPPDRVQVELAPAGTGAWRDLATPSAPPYAVTLDTAGLPDGRYDIRARAFQRDQAVGEFVLEARLVDNTPPTVAVDSPAPGTRLWGTVDLSAQAADTGSGVASIRFELQRGGEWASVGSARAEPYSVELATERLADGSYELRAVAVDVAGNEGTSEPFAIEIENVLPGRELRFSELGAFLRGPAEIAVAVSGDRPPERVELELSPSGSDGWRDLASVDRAPYSATLDTSDLDDGAYDLRARAYERGELVGETELRERVVDNTPPSVRMTEPAAGPHWGAVRVAAEATDDGSGVESVRIELARRGGEWRELASATEGLWDTGDVEDGAYSLRAVATDRAGNVAVGEPVAVEIENVLPPRELTLALPAAVLAGVVHFAAAVSAGRPPERVELEVAPAGTDRWRRLGAPGDVPYEAELDTAALEDGRYDLRARALERGQVVGETTRSGLLVDNTAPAISLAEPAAGTRIWGAARLAADVSDEVSGVAWVQFEVEEDGDWRRLVSASAAPFEAEWDTTDFADGEHRLRVVAADRAGNVGTSEPVRVEVENVLPARELRLADPGTLLHGAVALTVAVGSERRPESVEVELAPAGTENWRSLGRLTEPPYTLELDTRTLDDGVYDLRVRALERGQVVGETAVLERRVDNTAPTVRLVQPSAGGRLWGAVRVEAEAVDTASGVAAVRLELRREGGDWESLASIDAEPYAAELDTERRADGAYELRAVAADRAGNEASTEVLTVEIENVLPGRELRFADPGALLRGEVEVLVELGSERRPEAVTLEISPAGRGVWRTLAEVSDEPYAATLDTRQLDDGAYDLRAQAYERGTVVGEAVLPARQVDNAPPQLGVDAPERGAVLRGAAQLAASATDDVSGVSAVRFELGGRELGRIDRPPYELVVVTEELPDGEHVLRAVATDVAGNEATVEVPVVVENAVRIELGGIVQVVRRRVELTAATDARRPPKTVAFELAPARSGEWRELGRTTAPFLFPVETEALADGFYDFRALALDDAGGPLGESPVVEGVQVDNSEPTAAVVWPQQGASLQGTIAIRAEVDDTGSGVASTLFQFSPDGITWRPIVGGTRDADSVDWDTTAVADGPYAVRVTATDAASNSTTSDPVAVRVENALIAPLPRREDLAPAPPTPRPLQAVPTLPEQDVTLWDLERLVAAQPDPDPGVQEEREALLYYLRPYAAIDGSLPPEFRAMVDETFGSLL